jgi:HAD superfamily hydrolase (TIGR01509 family)
MKALIFDCDGVLVDTEKDGHRVELLKIGGGKERMKHYFDQRGWPPGRSADTLIGELHQRKTAIFTEIIAGGGMPLRSGVARIIDEAHAAGVRLAVCTTSAAKSVDSVLDLMGQQRKAYFEIVLAGDVVSKKKPDPEIYNLAKQRLRLDGRECVVIEDSRNGLLAAVGAGMPCLITKSTYTQDEDFREAARVVPELGDGPGARVTLQDLRAIAGA